MARERTLSDENVENILKLRKEGVSRRQLSKQYNINESTLYLIENGKAYKDVLQKLGYKHEPIVDRGNIKRNHRKLNDDNIIEIFKLLNNNVSTTDIKDKFNISYTLLNNIINGKAYNDIVTKHNLTHNKTV